MVRAFLIVVLAFVLTSCAKPEAFTIGEAIQAPHGWVDYCARNATDPDCKVTKQ